MHNDDERRDELPEHEYRDIERDGDVGAGVMGVGGTATDRGTGTLGGTAQGDADFEDDEPPRLGTPAVASHPEVDPFGR